MFWNQIKKIKFWINNSYINELYFIQQPCLSSTINSPCLFNHNWNQENINLRDGGAVSNFAQGAIKLKRGPDKLKYKQGCEGARLRAKLVVGIWFYIFRLENPWTDVTEIVSMSLKSYNFQNSLFWSSG